MKKFNKASAAVAIAGAANAAGKQHIAHKSALDFRRIKHHMARRVPWAMAHLQSVRPQGDRVAIGQPARGLEHPRWRKTISRSGLRQAVNPELVCGVRPDDRQATKLLGQIGRARGVVQVAMRDPDLLELQTLAAHSVQNQIQIAPWINYRRLATLVVPHE